MTTGHLHDCGWLFVFSVRRVSSPKSDLRLKCLVFILMWGLRGLEMRIVVIDDEACIRDTFKWHLEEKGHDVVTVDSPIGCDVFNDHDCTKDTPCGDVLFVNYFLTGCNALDFIEKMTEKGCKGILKNKFVMSGNIEMADHERANRLGCTLIQKPISFDKLDGLLDSCLRNQLQKLVKDSLAY